MRAEGQLGARAMATGDDEWQWPEEKPSASNYYNSAFGGAPPEPKKLTAAIASEIDPSQRTTMVRNYTWSDDTDFIRIYVPVPGVVRDGVSVQIGEDSVDLHAQTPEYGAFTMALRRLYDKVDLAKSSHKVLEKKEKVIIALAKFPPPDFGTSSYINYKPWYVLHHNSTANIQLTESLEQERLQRAARMNEPPKAPPMPTAAKRR